MILGEIAIPRQMGNIVDDVIPLRDSTLLLTQSVYLCGIILIILCAKAGFNFLQQIIGFRITRDQQTDLMKKLQTLGYSYYEKIPTGQTVSLFENSVKETQQTYTFLFPQFIYALCQFLVPSLVLIMKKPLFFVAIMIGNVAFIFLNKYANNKILYYQGLESKRAQISQQALYDSITSMSEVKIMGREDWAIDRTMLKFNDFKTIRMKSILWRHLRFTIVGLTLTISVVIFYFLGKNYIMEGSVTLGEFIGYSFLMGLISRGFSIFFYILPAQSHALNYARELYEFLQTEPDVQNSGKQRVVEHSLIEIKFDDVSFSYDKKVKNIKHFTIDIKKGKKTAIVGESGCGKSTLFKLIGRFYDVDEGEILVDGINIKNYELNDLRKRLGYVFQETYLFNMSVMDNIRFGNPDATDEEVVTAAKKAGAHSFITELDVKYDTIVGERGTKLSGGQKQRIAIARMFLKKPSVILLDEATSALDNMTEAFVTKTFETDTQEYTLITIAHRLSTIQNYDTIIYMENGRIEEVGNYQELMKLQRGFYNLAVKGGVE